MLYANGWPDYDEMHFMCRYLRPGDTFLDVGANIGIYTLLASLLVAQHGKVVAFDAGMKSYDRLVENIRLNGLAQAEARFAAIGPQPGTVRFLQSRDMTNHIAVGPPEADRDADVVEVPCVTLDAVLDGHRAAMGKMDIEGAEQLAFAGGPRALAAGNPPVWQLEMKERLLRKFGHSAAGFADSLRDQQYDLAVYRADLGELDFPRDAWAERGKVLAIFRPARDQIMSRIQEPHAPVAAVHPRGLPVPPLPARAATR
jgi:FkbM family methyltransferase